MSYRYLDHGADIGLEVVSDSLVGLFREAGRSVFSLMVEVDDIRAEESLELGVTNSSLEGLLYEWLSELLSLSNLNGHVYGDFPELTIEESNSGYELKARAEGEKINPERHELGTEVKAVTYQGLEIAEIDGGWRCRFVVDV